MECLLCLKGGLTTGTACPACGRVLVENVPPDLRHSKWLAALLSLPLPGGGHVYCGQVAKGSGIILVSFTIFPFVAMLAPIPFMVLYPAWLAYIAYGAWQAAGAAALETAEELARRAKPRGWLLWTWALLRACWILAGFGLPAAISASNAGIDLRDGALGMGLLLLLTASAFAAVAWTQCRYTVAALSGTIEVPETNLRRELTATAAIGGFLMLLAALVAPTFHGLFVRAAKARAAQGAAAR